MTAMVKFGDNTFNEHDGSSNDDDFHSVEGSDIEELLNHPPSENTSLTSASYHSAQKEKWRNLVAFWLLGLTNNYSYVVMLSAAHDILSNNFNNENDNIYGKNGSNIDPSFTNGSNPRDCNQMGTGTVLLADIIPSLVVKSMAPFIPFCIHFRIGVVIALCTSSFLLVGLAVSSSMALLGVVLASASAGLGEPTLLAYSAYYHEDVVSTWSSGTGGAGIFGAISYAGLTSLGLSPRQSILLMLIVPLIMSLSFWNVLEHPPHSKCCNSQQITPRGFYRYLDEDLATVRISNSPRLTFDEKLRIIPSFVKYMLPLSLVYFAEYLINQGLSELLYFPKEVSWISHEQQYRWYQVLYQVGVFISRSSVNLIHIKKIWITCVFQWLNVVLFLTGAIFWWFGSIWLAFVLILWEGLLGGAAYVNTFYRLSREVIPSEREFAIQITSMSDTFGITIAGFVAIPLHNFICNLPLYKY